MQTHLPLPDFYETARILDRRRLDRQRIEVYTILQSLAGLKDRWSNHPAVVMWRGAEFMLAEYGVAMCDEWRRQSYDDGLRDTIVNFVQDAMYQEIWTPVANGGQPWWYGVEGFHLSHRSNLVRKNPDHYRKIWPDVPATLDYVWPSHKPTVPRIRAGSPA